MREVVRGRVDDDLRERELVLAEAVGTERLHRDEADGRAGEEERELHDAQLPAERLSGLERDVDLTREEGALPFLRRARARPVVDRAQRVRRERVDVDDAVAVRDLVALGVEQRHGEADVLEDLVHRLAEHATERASVEGARQRPLQLVEDTEAPRLLLALAHERLGGDG